MESVFWAAQVNSDMPLRPSLVFSVCCALLVVAGPAAGQPLLSQTADTSTPGPAVSDDLTGPVPGQVVTGDRSERGMPAEIPVAARQTASPSDPQQRWFVQLRPNGDARWTISVTFQLDSQADRDAFLSIAEDFDDGNGDPLAIKAFRNATEWASEATGRSMALQDVERRSRIENDTGVLVQSFTWTNFAERNGSRLAVGDAFNTTSGTWLNDLSADQTLLIAPPSGYTVIDAPPVATEDRAKKWAGPVDLDGRNPWVIFEANEGVTPTTTTPTPNSPTTTTPTPNSPTTTTLTPTTGATTTTPGNGPASRLLPIAVLFGIGIALVAAYFLHRDPGSGAGPASPDSGGSGGTSAQSGGGEPGSDTATTDSGLSSESSTDPSVTGTVAGDTATGSGQGAKAGGGGEAGAGAKAGATADAGAEGETAADDEIDPGLLSDEERVERLIEQNGGRMKQATIVKETGWSNAKVSQLLSAMDEDDRIDKLRLGRENLISFPDEDVTDLESE